MNRHCHQVVYSERLGSLVAVGEHVTGLGKASSGQSPAPTSHFTYPFKSLVLWIALGINGWSLAAPAVNTLPVNGLVTSGSATISQQTNTLTINQSSQKAIINWDSFSIGSAASVNVMQNNAQSVLLNRVTGPDPSQLFGKFSANGQVILINPNGIVFGSGGSVTATSFTASTFDIDNSNFQKGNYLFQRLNSTANITIQNNATITTNASGYIALIAKQITNAGQLTTQGGSVLMAAGEAVQITSNLSLPLSQRVQLEITPSQLQTSIENTSSSVITTQGGQVLIQASSLVDLIAGVSPQIQQSGLINTTASQGGNVSITADNGQITVNGAIVADSTSAALGAKILIGRNDQTQLLATNATVTNATLSASHGLVETSAHHLTLSNNTVHAGTWFIDPDEVIIADPSHIDATDPNITYMSTTDLVNTLNSGSSVNFATNSSNGKGNITILDPIIKTQGGDAMLSLVADNNLYINNSISSTSGRLNINLQATNNLLSNTTTASINSNGGWISINAGNDLTQNFSIYSAGGEINLGSAQGNLSITNNISSSGGAISLQAETGNVLGSGNVQTDQNYTIDSAGGDLTIAAGNTISGGFTLNAGAGNLILANSVTAPSASLSATLLGQGTLEKQGPGTVILSGAGTFSGSTWIQGGTLQVGDGLSTNNALSNTNQITVDAFSTLNLMPTTGHSISIAAPISGEGSLVVSGTGGTAILTGANTYQGTTTVNDATQNPLVLQIGDGSNNTATLGTGLTYVGTGSTLQFVIKGDYTLSNNITSTTNALRTSSAGTVSANVTGALDVEGNISVSQINLNSTGVLTLNGNISTDSGMTLIGQSGIALNSTLFNDMTGDTQSSIVLQAGTATAASATSNAAIATGTQAQITQNANGVVQLTTDGNGNLYVPLIVNNGQGNVILGAGIQKAAGDGAQGQVLANTPTQAVQQMSTGATYVFTGDANLSGALGIIDSSLQNLYLSAVNGNSVNMKAYQGYSLNNLSPQTSVIFRNKVEFDTQIPLNSINVTYGQNPDSSAYINQAKANIVTDNAVISQSNSAGTTWWTTTNYASNITDLTYRNAQYSTSGNLAVNSTGYQMTMTGNDFVLSTTGKIMVTPLGVNVVSISASNKVYDGSTTATITGGQVQGLLGSDNVSVGANVANFSDPAVGTGKTIYASGFYLTGADAGNYQVMTSSSSSLKTTASITASNILIYPPSLLERVYILAEPSVRNATNILNENFQLASTEEEPHKEVCQARTTQTCQCDELQDVNSGYICDPSN